MAKRRKKHRQKGQPKPQRAAVPAEPEVLAPAAPRRLVWALAAALVLITATAYWNSFDGVFVYDSTDSISENPHGRRLWPLSEAISLPKWSRGGVEVGRPVTGFSFALTHVLFGPKPWGYHLVNLAIHIGAGLLLFGIVRRTLGRQPLRERFGRAGAWVAASVALLWMVHPLTTAAVTYVVQRAESMTGLFYLLTLYCCIRGFDGGRKGWYVAAVAACALGMGTKEVMFSAPLVVLVYDVVFVSRSFAAPFRRRGLYAALAATWVMFAPVFATLGAKGAELEALSPLRYLLTEAGVILHYLRLSFWPHPLVMDYNWPVAKTVAEVVPAGVLILLLLSLTGYGIARRRWFGFMGAWFFFILAPTSSIVPIPAAAHDHRMYLSLVAVVALAVLVVADGLRRLARRGPRVAALTLAGVVVCGVAAGLGYVTHERNKDYVSAKALWAQNVRHRPESFVAQNGLGLVLLDEGRFGDAEDCFRKAIAQAEVSKFSFPAPHLNLANTWIKLNRFDEAEAALGKAQELVDRPGPTHAPAVNVYNTFGDLCIKRGDWTGARAYFERSLAIDPHRPTTHSGLGVTLAHLEDVDGGVRHCEKALEIHKVLGMPREAYVAYDALGRVLELRRGPGDAERAVELFRKAIQLEPRSDAVHGNLGLALLQRGRLDEAAASLRRAVELNPRNPNACYNLGKLLLRRGDLSRAQQHLEKAVRLRPGHGLSWNDLGLVFLRRAIRLQHTEPDAAREQLERAVEKFRESIRLSPDSDQAHVAYNNLGICVTSLGRPEAALVHLRRALALKPDHVPSLNAMADAYARLRRFDKAIEYAERALKHVKPGQDEARRKIRANLEAYKAGRVVPRAPE